MPAVKAKTRAPSAEPVEEVEDPKPAEPRKMIPVKVGPGGATINREDFVFLLDTLRAGLSPREIVEQSSCVAFIGGRAITFNEEVMCSAPSGFPNDWTAAVLHKPLFDQIQKWPDDAVTVKLADGFKVTAGSRLLELNFEREVLMPLQAVEKPGNDWKPLHEDFTDAIGIVEACAGKDESNVALTCVHITPDFVEACDNYHLTRYRFKTGLSECCVKRDMIKMIPTLDMREYTETATWLHFRGRTGLVVSVRKRQEDYENLAPFLEVEGVKTVMPKSLSEAVERAKLLSDENSDNPQITVDLQPGKVVIRGDGTSGYFQEGKKVQYVGPRIKFTIGPTLLLELVKRHTDCVVSPNFRIKVDGPKWRYVAVLQPIDVREK